MKRHRRLHLGFEMLRPMPLSPHGGERLKLKLKRMAVMRCGGEKLHEEPMALDTIADIDMHLVGIWVPARYPT